MQAQPQVQVLSKCHQVISILHYLTFDRHRNLLHLAFQNSLLLLLQFAGLILLVSLLPALSAELF